MANSNERQTDDLSQSGIPQEQALLLDTENPPQVKGIKRLLSFIRNEWKNMWAISKAIVMDHEFFVSSLAVKGGLTSLILGGIIGLSSLVALPFVVAATAVAFNVALIGLGAYGIYMGAVKAEIKIRTILKDYYPFLAPKEHHHTFVVKTFRKLGKALTNDPLIKAIKNSTPVKRLFESSTWKNARKIVNRQEKILLGGLATGGSVFSVLMGILFLASQFVAVPLIAGGSLLTSLILGIIYTASGIFGGYFSINSLKESIQEWKEQRALRDEQKKQRALHCNKDNHPRPDGQRS